MESDKICRNLAFIAICTGVICTSTKAETLFFQGNMRSVQNGWQDDKLKIEIDTDGSKYRATLELLWNKYEKERDVGRYGVYDMIFGQNCKIDTKAGAGIYGSCSRQSLNLTMDGRQIVLTAMPGRVLGPLIPDIEYYMAHSFADGMPNSAKAKQYGLLQADGSQVSYGLPPSNGTEIYREIYDFRVDRNNDPICRTVAVGVSCQLRWAVRLKVRDPRIALAQGASDLLRGRTQIDRDRERFREVENQRYNTDYGLTFVPVTWVFRKVGDRWQSTEMNADMAAFAALLDRRRQAMASGSPPPRSDNPQQSLCRSLGAGVVAGGGSMGGPAGRAYQALGC